MIASDDDLDAGTRNKNTTAKHKTPDTLGDDWANFGGSSSTSQSKPAGRPAANDDDWADFTGSKNASAAAPAPTPAPAAPKTIDLLGMRSSFQILSILWFLFAFQAASISARLLRLQRP
jgi:hypothetical protein